METFLRNPAIGLLLLPFLLPAQNTSPPDSAAANRPIQGVIKVAQHPPREGLWVLDSVTDPYPFLVGYSNPNDSEGILDLISCGAHVVAFTTGRGSVIGSVISPVVKICGNPRTYGHMSGDMDVNAGRIMTGESTIAEVGREISICFCASRRVR